MIDGGAAAEGLRVAAKRRHLVGNALRDDGDGSVPGAGVDRLEPGGLGELGDALGQGVRRHVHLAGGLAHQHVPHAAADEQGQVPAALDGVEHLRRRRALEDVVADLHGGAMASHIALRMRAVAPQM